MAERTVSQFGNPSTAANWGPFFHAMTESDQTVEQQEAA